MGAFSSRSDRGRGRTWRRFLPAPGSPLSGATGGATLPTGLALSSQGFDLGLSPALGVKKGLGKAGIIGLGSVTEEDYWAISRRAGARGPVAEATRAYFLEPRSQDLRPLSGRSGDAQPSIRFTLTGAGEQTLGAGVTTEEQGNGSSS